MLSPISLTTLLSIPTALLSIPTALLSTSVLAYLFTPPKHSLLTSAVAWTSICTYTTLRVGHGSPSTAQRLAWAAGALFALSGVCERAGERSSMWWAKGLLPAVIFVIMRLDLLPDTGWDDKSRPSSPIKMARESSSDAGSSTVLAIGVSAAVIALYAHSGVTEAIALGICEGIVLSLALILAQRALNDAQHARHNGASVVYYDNKSLNQHPKPAVSEHEAPFIMARDVSVGAALCTAVGAVALESWRFSGLAYWGLLGQIMGDKWVFWQGILNTLYGLGMVIVHMAMEGLLLFLIYRRGAFRASFLPLAAALVAQLSVGFSLSRLWFALLCAGSTFLFLDDYEGSASFTRSRRRRRMKRLLWYTAALSFIGLIRYYIRAGWQVPHVGVPLTPPNDPFTYGPTPEALQPLLYNNTRFHPIDQLVSDAEAQWMATLQGQSQTLEDAIAEYRRRYRLPPPPNFDKWFGFAKNNNVQLIDEYDTIYHSLLPFWALPPGTVRARAREALGFGGNNLIAIQIRGGQVVNVEGGENWQQQATVGMMRQFVVYLPDMDLAFNIHDEPRVVVPHDELTRLVHLARSNTIPAAFANATPMNAFSRRPLDVNSGKRIDEVKTTRFNQFAHQSTWLPSRLSCSPNSPARSLLVEISADNLTAYALGELGFVYNQTAFSDVCNSPSFATSHGFFERPNSFNVVHDLIPIFSQSKISSFNDILYPSPWYWYDKVSYDESEDLRWKEKKNRLWWRGSTTGGYSRDGGWRRLHRQQFVRKMTALDDAKILSNIAVIGTTDTNSADANILNWQAKEVPRQDYKELMDVHFSSIGQCDPGDCNAQREFFNVVPPADQQDAWKYKYLLDIDGNAFSGRFYAFLKSHSLVFKMAVFREWHEEWIKPWVHYIPLSLRGDEALESVRYFSGEEEGKRHGGRMAEAGRIWAGQALRNADFEAWFFRLLLEYGRVIDENRENIGYGGGG